MNAIDRIDNALFRIELGLVIGIHAALAGVVLFNIVARDLLGISFDALLALPPTLVMWLAMVGATLALRENRHIRMEIVLRHAPPRFRRAARRLTALFGAVVMAVLSYSAVGFVTSEIATFGPHGWLAVAFPLFFAVAAFRFALAAYRGSDTEPSAPPSDDASGEGAP